MIWTAPIIVAAMIGAAGSASAQASHPLVDLMREACVATDMQRNALESLATERRWEPWLLMVRSQADIDRHNALPDWDIGYGVFGVGAVSMYGPKTHRPMVTRCSVEAKFSQGDWRTAVDQLASELDMALEQDKPVEGGDLKTWSAASGRTLSASYDAREYEVTITLGQRLPTQ